MATSTARPRRSQAERSATTREALLDATVACVIEDGYAHTTTSRVAERAGVSRGAHLHHFQTRSALVAEAIEHLSRRRGMELLAAAEDLPTGGRGRIAAGLDLLWSTYASPLFQAAIELWANARTDPELREHLLEVEQMLDRQTLELARTIFPDAARARGCEALGEPALPTTRGPALPDPLHPGARRNADQWPHAREVLVRA